MEDVGRRIILRQNLKELELTGIMYLRGPVMGSCEHCNELSGSMKSRYFLTM
jgi:hypothetical protein